MKSILAALLIFTTPVLAQYQVGERTVTYNDPARNNRAIECEIYYPSNSAGNNVAIASSEFPVIVFGHGFAMQVGAYPNFWNEYVPQGYIMVFPTTEGGTIFPPPDHGAFGEDLQFLVNRMQAEGQNAGSPFYQAVSDRSAIMGHSMGGGASFLASSGFTNVDCVVGLAPAETDPSAISAAVNITAPVLVFSGTSDGVTPSAEHHIPIYNAAGSSCKYFVNIENGSHCYFASNTFTCTLGEITPGSLDAEDQRQVTYAVLTPWLNYFLKNDCSAWDDFQTALASESNLGTINSTCANDAPTIVNNGGTLESDQQANYQWYLNGNEIQGANQQTYVFSQAGTYQVGTVNVGNCPVLSNEITVTVTGIVENSLRISSITREDVLITSSTVLNGMSVDWFDTSGRIIESRQLNTSGNSFRVQKPAFEGLKLLRIQSDDISEVLKVY